MAGRSSCEELPAFYDFQAEHCLRTTNPIESTFAMVFEPVESAQQRWRAVTAPHLVALVRAGARFERGHLVERPDAHAA
ncbi:hypothetical protein [Streptomyces chartreusis]|uniref:hypothetical protein n=1 Tax=Streptomyces chartreusis TaxID=1969 RepID=UPI003F4D3F60